ncbi:MAG: UDP-N-acetylmuramoyl-L-alanyl-D-glutamate--2,6-diaminopimelate ligase [bacterium]|nr:UDP-N-acetylmuramoyl-L-alanyl-D-glutamate--2,6-diaminopimelate ligase [bacterium]
MEDKVLDITVQLSAILKGTRGIIDCVQGDNERTISSVEYDSRKVQKGSLFVAIKGYETDGHRYIDTAIKNGAAAILVSVERAEEFKTLSHNSGISLLVSSDTRRALSAASALFYGYPSRSLTVIGITGTNGKTSITYMVESILRANGMNPGVVGTVNYRWGTKEVPAPNTTPESRDLHEMFYAMKKDGVDSVVFEVSSHALELGRADDIELDAAVFTNLTRDHLDFHKNFDNYFEAKKILFRLLEKSGKERKTGIINVDDEYGKKLYRELENCSYPVLGFGLEQEARYRPNGESIQNLITGLRYVLEAPEKGCQIEMQVSGTFQLYNSLAAIAASHSVGVSFDRIAQGLRDLETVPGRFDVVQSGQGYYVVVDYAHSGDALLKLLCSVNELNPNRVITVFGCGGDRDKTKRPVMGKIAIENSTLAIVTSDNPRTEDPGDIITDILQGLNEKNGKDYDVVPDREEAIERAIAIAEEGDIIVIAGKGHEDYQVLGKEKIHFDDKEIAKKYIEARRAG